MTKTKNQDVNSEKRVSVSRKRSYNQSNNSEIGEKKDEKSDRDCKDDEPAASTSKIPLARPPRRKKKKKGLKNCDYSDSKKPLVGMTISVSTLSDNTKSKNTGIPDQNDTQTASISYNEVCRSCRELGADVIDLVCKRVNILVCSEAAVRHATQRVRKAIKKNKPLVSVTWVDQCRREGRKVDFEEYRLDKKAKDSIQNREDRINSADDNLHDICFEALPDSGWSEPKDLGCCCVCHENGTTADCPWCVDCPLNT